MLARGSDPPEPPGASMAMLTGVALICSLISLYVLGSNSRQPAGHNAPATESRGR